MTNSIRESSKNICCYRPISGNKTRLIWNITGFCNLNCRHCFIKKYPASERKERELSFSRCLELIREFPNVKIGKVMLTGGEPFSRSDLPDIITAIKEIDKNIIIDITTNLTYLSDDIIAQLKRVGIDEITTSLDGDEEVHDFIRQSKGNFKIVTQNIKKLRQANILVDVVCVVQRSNFRILEKIIAIAEELDITSLTFSDLIVPEGIDYSLEILSASEKTEIIKYLDGIRKSRLNISDRIPVRMVGFDSAKKISHPCLMSNILTITNENKLCRCLLSDSADGENIANVSLQEAIKKIKPVNCFK